VAFDKQVTATKIRRACSSWYLICSRDSVILVVAIRDKCRDGRIELSWVQDLNSHSVVPAHSILESEWAGIVNVHKLGDIKGT